MSKGFWIVAVLFICLLSVTGVAAAQMSPRTGSAGSGDLFFTVISGGASSGLVADSVGATRRPLPDLVPPLTLPRKSPELALVIYEARASRQAAELASYSATTVVRADLPDSSQHGEFELERHYAAPHSLEFKAVHFTGDNFVKGNVIVRLLRSEVDHAQRDDPAMTALNSANYKFSYKATDRSPFSVTGPGLVSGSY